MNGVRLFISAGEASGDAYGAAIVRAVRGQEPTVEVQAMGGGSLRREGVDLVADSSLNAAIGIVRSIGIAPRVFFASVRVRRALSKGNPGVFVPIDYGFINIRLAKHAKRQGWKVLYFVPPGSWRKDRQGADLPKVADAIVTPFSWSCKILERMGARAYWFGHPIKSITMMQAPGDRSRIAVLPGSRKQEIQHNLPVIAVAANGLPQLEFAVAQSVGREALKAKWLSLAPDRADDVFTEGDVAGVLARARAAIVCSGTATLQAAVARCPMVVIYRFSKLITFEAKLLGLHKKIRFISLPNIFLDRAAVPELVGEAATPEAIRGHLDALVTDSEPRRHQLEDFEELDQLLGPADCIDKTADLILELAGRLGTR